MFRFYCEVARTAFRRQAIYRWANLAGLTTNIFFSAIFSYIIIGLFHVRPSVAGFTLVDTLRYTWLVQALLMIIIPFGWTDLMLTIRTGEVVTDLSKPCNFYWYWFSREVGRNGYYILFRALPIYLAGMLFFKLGAPAIGPNWLGFGLSVLLGTMLGIAYRFLYNIVAFWIVEARSMTTLAQTSALFFTGSFIPIPFLPPWARSIIEWLPFNGLMNLPSQILLGKISGGTFWLEVARQVGWVMVLTCGCLLLTRIATRRVVSQGG